MALKTSTMNFTMNWLGHKASLFLFLTTLIVFSSCKKEPTNVDLDLKDNDFQLGSYFTDTITVNTSTVYVRDSIKSSNTLLMSGAYLDPELGKVWCNTFAQIRQAAENIDYTGGVVTSATLQLDYAYAYGDTLESQTFEVYALPTALDKDESYYTLTPSQDLSALTAVGTATFQAKPNTSKSYISITLNNTYAQQVLDASDNVSNDVFISSINGLAVVPLDHDKGAILKFLFSAETNLTINYTKSSQTLKATYLINGNSARYFTGEFDRTGTTVSGLVNTYDEVSTVVTGGNLFLETMMGIKLKVSFPYIEEFLMPATGHVLVNKAILYMPITTSTNTTLKEPSALIMAMTDASGEILMENGKPRFIQNDFAPATGTTSNQIVYTDANDTYFSGNLSSYFLANQTGKLPFGRAILVTPFLNDAEVNRAVVNGTGLKLKVYYSIIK